jgi:GH25 family lysozyme M1 (1,4-beta-N-acetylmuramidase)
MAKIVGNDVSRWQGTINWDIYKVNTNFCILKATEGTGFVDPEFVRNQSEGHRTGVPLGFYHFARPDLGNSPQAEVDFFLSKLGPLTEGEVLVLDYEPPSQNAGHIAWCRTWLDYVFSKNGVRPLIYLNQSQISTFDWSPVVNGGYGLWIAAYTNDPNNNTFNDGEWPFTAMQQWTNAQRVPGILNGTGAVDGNVFFGDLATFKRYGYKPPAPPPPAIDYKALYEQSQRDLAAARAQLATANTRIALLEEKLREIRNIVNSAGV